MNTASRYVRRAARMWPPSLGLLAVLCHGDLLARGRETDPGAGAVAPKRTMGELSITSAAKTTGGAAFAKPALFTGDYLLSISPQESVP